MPTLIVKSPRERVFPLEVHRVTIGRSPSNILQIDDDKVSRRHCRIDREGDALFIQDLRSANGTLINGKLTRDRQELKDKDEIKLGNTTILFTLKGADEISSIAEAGSEPEKDEDATAGIIEPEAAKPPRL